MPSDKDVVAEARELLNASNAYTIRIQVRELIDALADEVERLRNQWDTRFSILCGNCGKRYLGPRDEHLHGYDICNVPRKDHHARS